MNIPVSPAASVAFDAKHWRNSFLLGQEKAIMGTAGALVGEFAAAEDVPPHQRQVAESIWEGVLQSCYPDLIERFVSDRRLKPQHHTADNWRMDLVMDAEFMGPYHQGLGIAVHRFVRIFPTSDGNKELLSGRLPRDYLYREDGVSATELFVWTRPEVRRQGIASEVVRKLNMSPITRKNFMLVDGYTLDPEDNQAGVRLVEKFVPATISA